MEHRLRTPHQDGATQSAAINERLGVGRWEAVNFLRTSAKGSKYVLNRGHRR